MSCMECCGKWWLGYRCCVSCLQAELKVDHHSPSCTTISSRYTMKPTPAPAAASSADAAAGVGEFSGAHWFADLPVDAVETLVERMLQQAANEAAPAAEPANSGAAAADSAAAEQPTSNMLGNLAHSAGADPAGTSDAALQATATVESSAAQQGCDPEGAIHVTASYTIITNNPCGQPCVLGDWDIDATGALPAKLPTSLHRSLPRVGLHGLVPARYQGIAWYGRGPHECYPDRKASARMQVHHMPVEQLYVPYIHPQEAGGRADVRWLHLTNTSTTGGSSSKTVSVANGLLIASADSQKLQMNVCKYSWQQLAAAKHQHELESSSHQQHQQGDQSPPTLFGPPIASTGAAAAQTSSALSTVDSSWHHVHLDVAHMGVGGDDSWSPSVHQEYLVPPGKYSMSLLLRPTDG
eukprot:GHRR01009005.1.p1 GENE.GHRR01009005.1~~GHRR01009005.1.p1  ORF type:complete len:410 (+),score=156.88 GHRR01009005.1:1132-2361(+)